MDLQARLDVLERALGRLGVRLVEEELPEEAHIDGGLCTIGGRQVLYLSPKAPPWRRVEVLLDALRRLPHTGIWLPPEIRHLVEDPAADDAPASGSGELVASAGGGPHDSKAEEVNR